MSDFFQNGLITTFQDLVAPDRERFEAELSVFAKARPLALVLPCLYSELEGEALPRILAELRVVPYIEEIVVTLGGANREEYLHARDFFAGLPQKTAILWNEGPRVQAILETIRKNGLYVGSPGKGLSVWTAYGYILGDPALRTVALHDCDILTYDRILLHRLVYPIMNPRLDYEFCKGYYARVTDRLYGRVTRLFVTPLIRALEKILGPTPFLLYLDGYRYPLAGEFAMDADVARINRIPSDWGLEMGTLAEVYRNYATRRLCQVDLGIAYEHKHQATGGEDATEGLMRMAREISLALFHSLASEGTFLPPSFFHGLKAAYLRCAQDAVRQYSDLSALNGLVHDRHGEDLLVYAFTKAVDKAGQQFLADPFGSPQIPNWNSVASAIPDVFDRIRAAVSEDGGM